MLAGAPLVMQPQINSVQGLSPSSSDDPELWDFTLDRIDELNGPEGGEASRGPRPSTPGNHQMQTRSMTPQRGPTCPGRPPDRAPLQGSPTYSHQAPGQPNPQYTNLKPNHPQGKPGKTCICVRVCVCIVSNCVSLICRSGI